MDIILDGDYPRTSLDKFSSIPSSGSQEKDFNKFPLFQPIWGSHSWIEDEQGHMT